MWERFCNREDDPLIPERFFFKFNSSCMISRCYGLFLRTHCAEETEWLSWWCVWVLIFGLWVQALCWVWRLQKNEILKKKKKYSMYNSTFKDSFASLKADSETGNQLQVGFLRGVGGLLFFFLFGFWLGYLWGFVWFSDLRSDHSWGMEKGDKEGEVTSKRHFALWQLELSPSVEIWGHCRALLRAIPINWIYQPSLIEGGS